MAESEKNNTPEEKKKNGLFSKIGKFGRKWAKRAQFLLLVNMLALLLGPIAIIGGVALFLLYKAAKGKNNSQTTTLKGEIKELKEKLETLLAKNQTKQKEFENSLREDGGLSQDPLETTEDITKGQELDLENPNAAVQTATLQQNQALNAQQDPVGTKDTPEIISQDSERESLGEEVGGGEGSRVQEQKDTDKFDDELEAAIAMSLEEEPDQEQTGELDTSKDGVEAARAKEKINSDTSNNTEETAATEMLRAAVEPQEPQEKEIKTGFFSNRIERLKAAVTKRVEVRNDIKKLRTDTKNTLKSDIGINMTKSKDHTVQTRHEIKNARAVKLARKEIEIMEDLESTPAREKLISDFKEQIEEMTMPSDKGLKTGVVSNKVQRATMGVTSRLAVRKQNQDLRSTTKNNLSETIGKKMTDSKVQAKDEQQKIKEARTSKKSHKKLTKQLQNLAKTNDKAAEDARKRNTKRQTDAQASRQGKGRKAVKAI